MLIDELERLQCVRCDHLKVGITAFEVFEAFNESHRKSLPVKLRCQDLHGIEHHFGIALDSLFRIAPEEEGKVLSFHVS